MAHVSTNSIQNLNEDWGYDENTGLPFSGEAVQTFIKSFLQNVTAAAWFNTTNYTMYFFASEEDRDAYMNDPTSVDPTFSCPMSFNSTLYRVNITNNTGTTQINIATNAESLVLSTSFVVQMKAITDQDWTDLQTGCYVTILIDRGLTGNYEPLTERRLYAPYSTISLDVFPELANGINRVKFQFEAEDGSVTQSLVYSVNLAELYVELFNNNWSQPVLESDPLTYKLGGYKIAGAGDKTLHINLYNASGTKVVDDIQVFIGPTNAYVNSPYDYPIPLGSPIFDLSTGTYTAEVYVTTPGMSSLAITYDMMLVKTAHTNTARLVCINSVADKIFNYSEGALCTYAVYDGGASYADVTEVIQRMNGTTVIDTTTLSLEDVPTSQAQPLNYSVIWPGIEGANYSIGFTLTIGTSSGSGNVPVDNSTVFPPTPNYDFYMLAANRSNGESETERVKIVNVANNAKLAATWTDVDFTNGIDGWTTDDSGRACLRIPAGTKVILPTSSFNLLSGDNQTFEICYKVVNVADYDENIITLSPNPTVAGFRGVRIRPTNITVHSSANTDAGADSLQGTNLCDDETVHFVLTINPNFRGGKLVTGYVNGCKNFLFDYSSSTVWSGFGGNLSIGSARSDVFVYFIRHYPTALPEDAVQVNYINSLATPEERAEIKENFASVLYSGSNIIDFEAVRDNNYNYFVVEMVQGNGIPSAANGWGKTTTGLSVLEMHYGEHPEWDWRIGSSSIAVETTGQGTTSMNYYRWNVRWRIDKSNSNAASDNDKKKVPIQYVTGRTRVGGKYQYTWGSASLNKTVNFDGTTHPSVMRITAKINQASSMQSHKMGATRAYTELHDAIGLRNEAQTSADNNNTPRPVVSVYQYPAFGFEKVGNSYTFVGLFTIGPDKGDKPTFGYDVVKNSLISMEGTDHSEPLARFAYPYSVGTGVGSVNYFYGQEGLSINVGNGSYMTGLEIGNCHNLEIDKTKGAEDEQAVRNILNGGSGVVAQFKPAYELVWNNSTLIFPVTPSTYGQSSVANTLTYINNHLSGETVADNFRLTPYNDRLTYADMQFWIVGDNSYNLYYYDEADKIYKQSGISLSSQNGTPSGSTANDKNEWFKAKRRERFMASASDYWDLDDCIYHFVFCVLFGATDNFAKNSYPYKMATFANNGRWKWRQDDLDTIFDIDNSGRDTKPYYIEFEDSHNGSAYFAGSNSVFWNLINECYWENYNNGAGRGIRAIGQLVLNAMMERSGKSNPYDGFVSYIERCFWDNAQGYFPVSAYNVDCSFKYEEAWVNNGQEVPALSQALGNHYSGERLWVRRRAVYMLSLFRYGPFGDYSSDVLGRISFRPLALSLDLVPFLWMYPAVEIGQNTVVTGDRTQPGVTRSISASVDPSGNTFAYIQATNYLAELGNFKNTRLGANDTANVIITAAKLINFYIGDATAGNVTTNIPGLNFKNTKCLETIDARNASEIKEILGLENCTRLRSLLLAGTSVTSVALQDGSKIETLSYPAGIQEVVLRSLKHLTSFTMPSYASIITLIIEDTDIDVFAILTAAYGATNSALRNIRLLWKDVIQKSGSSFCNMLQDLAGGDYSGIGADGSTVLPKPFLEGTVQISNIYADDFYGIDIISEIEYQENLRKGLSGLFNSNFYVVYDPTAIWIRFADANVKSICVSNWDTNGDGEISTAEAAAVTTIKGKFSGNTTITSFDELKYFTGIVHANNTTSGLYEAFSGCTNLVSVSFPEVSPSTGSYWGKSLCQNCSNLERIYWPLQTGLACQYAFAGCSKLTRVDIKSLEQWCSCGFGEYNTTYRYGPFDVSQNGHIYLNGVELQDIEIPYGFTTVRSCFRYVKGLRTVTLPSTVTSIGASAFYGSGLTSLTLHEGITSIGASAFYGCSSWTGDVVVPSTVTSIGASAFYNCRGFRNFTTPSSVSDLPLYYISNTGNETGTLIVKGSSLRNQSNINFFFKVMIFEGNFTGTSGYSLSSRPCVEQIRFKGNYTQSAGSLIHTYSNGESRLGFVEVLGNVTVTGDSMLASSGGAACANGCIIHFAYNGLVSSSVSGVISSAANTRNRVAKIYVGDGSSAAHDNAILAQYTADSDWGTISSKLDTWYNYINSADANPDYIN